MVGELKIGSPASIVKVLAEVLKKPTSSVIAIGNNGIEAGVIMRLVETTNDKPIIEGWSLGLYGGTRKQWDVKKVLLPTVGGAIEKKLFSKPLFDVGAAVLVTKPVRDFLSKSGVNVSAGFTVKF